MVTSLSLALITRAANHNKQAVLDCFWEMVKVTFAQELQNAPSPADQEWCYDLAEFATLFNQHAELAALFDRSEELSAWLKNKINEDQRANSLMAYARTLGHAACIAELETREIPNTVFTATDGGINSEVFDVAEPL